MRRKTTHAVMEKTFDNLMEAIAFPGTIWHGLATEILGGDPNDVANATRLGETISDLVGFYVVENGSRDFPDGPYASEGAALDAIARGRP